MMVAAPLWYSAREIAAMALPGMPATERGVQLRAKKAGWLTARSINGAPLARKRSGRGGGVEWHVSLLPSQAVSAPDMATGNDHVAAVRRELSALDGPSRRTALLALLAEELGA